MREISPAMNVSAEAYYDLLSPAARAGITRIREEKAANCRPLPSARLDDRSTLLDPVKRQAILDRVAMLVDENLGGRSEMCLQFAELLALALNHLGLSARGVVGEATYSDERGLELFRWRHAWVRVGEEVIDGNADILGENPVVPKAVQLLAYWGPIRETPTGRHLRENRGESLGCDPDVTNIWWPELKLWLDSLRETP